MTAFQLFKWLMNNVDTLIIKMPLTDDILNTQCYDKVDECKPLEYNSNKIKHADYKHTKTRQTIIIKYYVILKILHLEPHMSHIYAGLIITIISKSL